MKSEAFFPCLRLIRIIFNYKTALILGKRIVVETRKALFVVGESFDKLLPVDAGLQVI